MSIFLFILIAIALGGLAVAHTPPVMYDSDDEADDE